MEITWEQAVVYLLFINIVMIFTSGEKVVNATKSLEKTLREIAEKNISDEEQSPAEKKFYKGVEK